MIKQKPDYQHTELSLKQSRIKIRNCQIKTGSFQCIHQTEKMTSVFFQGKYRQRKDWSTSSIPELVSLEEEASHVLPEIPTTLPPKAPRRSSLAIGLLVGGRGLTDPKSKRRSSIATAFLGRQNKVIHIFSPVDLFCSRILYFLHLFVPFLSFVFVFVFI